MAEQAVRPATTPAAPEAVPSPNAAPHSGLAAVQAVTGSDPAAVATIAHLIETYPAERDAIMTWLHQARGNAFVQQVLAPTSSGSHPIGASVGEGGHNEPGDVRTVQAALAKHAVHVGLVDGLAGPRTIAAIRAFQSGFLHRPDGLVEPGGITENHLTGTPRHAAPAGSGPGARDALGAKENLLAPFFADMQEVADELAPQFVPIGLQLTPQILLATAMQESAAAHPLTARSFDNGLGLMQITPYHGRLDPGVARAIGWDNSKTIEENVAESNWRDAKANLRAGGLTMLGKARAIRHGVPELWEQMIENDRWRAVLFAYNAGEANAIRALRAGGPGGPMISTYTVNGHRVSHDYTAELQSKLDYVGRHDPFGPAPTTVA